MLWCTRERAPRQLASRAEPAGRSGAPARPRAALERDRGAGNGPAAPVLLYDGQCAFCQRQVERLHRMVGGAITVLSFHGPGVLDRYPQVDREQCMRELKLIHEDGRVEGGIAAVAGTLRFSARWRWLAFVLAAPGVRAVAGLGYRAIARLRYRLMGRCGPGGACAAHSAAGRMRAERPARRS